MVVADLLRVSAPTCLILVVLLLLFNEQVPTTQDRFLR